MQNVLITGGSSGIGFELSKYFARDGYQLLWVSKPEEELQNAKTKLLAEYPNISIHTFALDLAQEGSAQKVYNWTLDNQWQVDVLVNNAGFGNYGFLTEVSIEKELAMIQLNVATVYALTHLFLKEMKARNAGKILNISSNTSLQPVPRMATYAATKAFVKHFSESVHEELKHQKSKVTLTVVCPSAIKNTQFQHEANMDKVRTFNSLLTTTPEEVARDAYKGLQKGKKRVLTGARLRNTHWLTQLLPPSLTRFVLHRELDKV
jgi:hypothetical protein